MDWPIFGTAYHFYSHALICNCAQRGNALREFVEVAVARFRAQDTQLALATVISYLEQARSNNLADIRIALCVLALEALTHRLCLRDGFTERQLIAMNIQQKLNRAGKNMGMGFIEKKFTEEAREMIRNPLVHTRQIPGLSIEEKVAWYDNLYALAFKMLLFLLGYKGKWLDLSDQWKVVNAS